MPKGILMDPLRSKNISEVLIERVVASIMTGELAPGEKLLSEDEFAQQAGVGRSSVREAVKILEALGLVEIRRADGTYIVDEFNGRMLNPLTLGLVMAPKSNRHLREFKLSVQRMALGGRMSADAPKALDEAAALIEKAVALADGDCSAFFAQAHKAEVALARAVDNPMAAELYRRTIELASYLCASTVEQQGIEGAHAYAAIIAEMVSALRSGDASKLEGALDRELSFLSGTK